MPTAYRSTLAPMVANLASRGFIAGEARQALLDLPHSVATLAPGRHLVRSGDHPSSCYVVLEGFVCRHRMVGNGSRQIVGIHARGDLMALQDALLGRAEDNLQALTHVQVAKIDVRSLMAVVERFSSIALALLRDALVAAASLSEWVVNVGRRDAFARVAHILCELYLRQQALGMATGREFEIPMSQDQLADALGLTSVHVNRTLKQMEAEGLIERSRRVVRIVDGKALARAGDFDPRYLHLPDRLGTAANAIHAIVPERSRPAKRMQAAH